MQVRTSLQTDNHTSTPLLSFLQAGCPSCCPTNSVKALKAIYNNNQYSIIVGSGIGSSMAGMVATISTQNVLWQLATPYQ